MGPHFAERGKAIVDVVTGDSGVVVDGRRKKTFFDAWQEHPMNT